MTSGLASCFLYQRMCGSVWLHSKDSMVAQNTALLQNAYQHNKALKEVSWSGSQIPAALSEIRCTLANRVYPKWSGKQMVRDEFIRSIRFQLNCGAAHLPWRKPCNYQAAQWKLHRGKRRNFVSQSQQIMAVKCLSPMSNQYHIQSTKEALHAHIEQFSRQSSELKQTLTADE